MVGKVGMEGLEIGRLVMKLAGGEYTHGRRKAWRVGRASERGPGRVAVAGGGKGGCMQTPWRRGEGHGEGRKDRP